jgi:hypothetical protein
VLLLLLSLPALKVLLTECKQNFRRDWGDTSLSKMAKKFIDHTLVEVGF